MYVSCRNISHVAAHKVLVSQIVWWSQSDVVGNMRQHQHHAETETTKVARAHHPRGAEGPDRVP